MMTNAMMGAILVGVLVLIGLISYLVYRANTAKSGSSKDDGKSGSSKDDGTKKYLSM